MKNEIEILPKEFVINVKYNRNPLWKKYIKWLNNKTNANVLSNMDTGFYGINSDNAATYCFTNNDGTPELSIYQWYAAINNVPDFTVEGTKLPDMINSRYCTVNSPQFSAYGTLNIATSYNLFYSRKVITINDEICIGAEKLDYTDDNLFVFKLDDIIKIYKKENQMETKNVVAYKIKEKYIDAYIKLFNIHHKTAEEYLNEPHTFLYKSSRYNTVVTLNLLDIWFDEVYEEDIKLPIINGYSGKYDKENHIIVYGCAKIYAPYIRSVYDGIIAFNINNNLNVANRSIKSITLSSDVTISLQQLREIVEYIDNM